ncbi:MAG: sensor histidine kinase [Acidimicrobiales bacterium]
MSQTRPPPSLRRRLFGSHLLVMVVAFVVLVVVVVAVQAIDEVVRLRLGRGESGAPIAALLGLVAAMIASAIVSWSMTRRLATPLEEIGAATRELAAGRYEVRVPRAGTAELDALASDVDQLADELATTERRRLRLIGDVAHELRNPLSTIEGTMEALLDGVVPADDDTFARIGREAARLHRLADDLSSLSEAGELGIAKREPVDLASVVGQVSAQLEPQAAAKNLELTVEGEAALTVLGDRDRLTQVVMNVLGNAVQYTSEGGVQIRLGTDVDGMAVIDVVDSGRGLTVENRTRIFERFHRVDQNFNDGTGVGLAIAKLLVEAHGGRITADSDGLGAGTTIRIELPTPAR